MPGKRQYKRLTPLEVRNLKRPGLYPDGGGLYLRVSDNGSKNWVLRFKLAKQAKMMGLGSLRQVGLAEAREKAEEATARADRAWLQVNISRLVRGGDQFPP